MHACMHVCNMYIHIYLHTHMCVERERERDPGREIAEVIGVIGLPVLFGKAPQQLQAQT